MIKRDSMTQPLTSLKAPSQSSWARALKNLETAWKNEAVTQEREAQIQRAEKESEAKPNDPQAPITWRGFMHSRARKRAPTNGSTWLSAGL
jgi:hypothetical protein